MRGRTGDRGIPSHIAYLTDRVLLAEGESQVYATQMATVGGEYPAGEPPRPRQRRYLTVVYVMNRMSPDILGSDRSSEYLEIVYRHADRLVPAGSHATEETS